MHIYWRLYVNEIAEHYILVEIHVCKSYVDSYICNNVRDRCFVQRRFLIVYFQNLFISL